MKKRSFFCTLIGIGCLIVRSSLYPQGSLTPPGTPAPTMKSLDQIASTGIALNATNTPGDSSDQFVISSPGSYYLPANVTGVSGKNCILVNSNDVTIDLNGFSLTGVSGALVAITTPAKINIAVRNGTVRGWSGSAAVFLGNYSLVEDVRVFDTTGGTGAGNGIFVGNSSVVYHCIARNNSGTGFVLGGDSCEISDSTAELNGTGISNGSARAMTVRGCTVNSNTTTGIAPNLDPLIVNCSILSNGTGVSGGSHGNLIGCVINQNHAGVNCASGWNVKNCTVNINSGTGITLTDNAIVEGCEASTNSGNGIQIGNSGTIIKCLANSNGSGTTGAGIVAGTRTSILSCVTNTNQADGMDFGTESTVRDNHASGNGAGSGSNVAAFNTSGGRSRIESNHATGNTGYGFSFSAVDVVLRNSGSANLSNDYSSTSGTYFGPVQTPNSATNPFANISSP